MAKDPVCGMQIEEKDAAATTEFRGKMYFFCSVKCKAEFLSNPERYVESEEYGSGHHHHHN